MPQFKPEGGTQPLETGRVYCGLITEDQQPTEHSGESRICWSVGRPLVRQGAKFYLAQQINADDGTCRPEGIWQCQSNGPGPSNNRPEY